MKSRMVSHNAVKVDSDSSGVRCCRNTSNITSRVEVNCGESTIRNVVTVVLCKAVSKLAFAFLPDCEDRCFDRRFPRADAGEET